jgi:hypothetical protein
MTKLIHHIIMRNMDEFSNLQAYIRDELVLLHTIHILASYPSQSHFLGMTSGSNKHISLTIVIPQTCSQSVILVHPIWYTCEIDARNPLPLQQSKHLRCITLDLYQMASSCPTPTCFFPHIYSIAIAASSFF